MNDRKIKFRIWDNEENKFFEPIYEAYKGKLLDLSFDTNGRLLRRTLEMPAEHESNFSGRYELSQFIGHKDIKDVEIYEGDFDCDGNLVVWCDECCGWEFAALDIPTGEVVINYHRCEGNFFIQDIIKEFEVYGNIYQLKNLIRQNKN
jgi:hypothetical protein